MINEIIRVLFLSILTAIYITVAVIGILVDSIAEVINQFLDGMEDLIDNIKNLFND